MGKVQGAHVRHGLLDTRCVCLVNYGGLRSCSEIGQLSSLIIIIIIILISPNTDDLIPVLLFFEQ